MVNYGAALSRHPVPAQAVGEVAGSILEQLDGERPDVLVCFASPHLVGAFDEVTAALRRLLEPGVLLGATTAAVIGGGHEAEEVPALSAWAARLEGDVVPVGLEMVQTADGPAVGRERFVTGWPGEHPATAAAHTLLLLADPFTFPVEAFLGRLGEDRPGLQVIGGMASAAHGPGGNRLVLDGDVLAEGAVGVLLAGAPAVTTVVSQGCRPVGEPYIVTGAEDNVVRTLAGRPALERLAEVAEALPDEERQLLAQGLHVGLVVDEHRAEFGRGDFLVRNVLGASRETGAISVGTTVGVGQTLQFHVRDAVAADEDLRVLLAEAASGDAGGGIDAALLFTCTGRGRRLFGIDSHDAGVVDELLGPLPVAGAFCAGELGPVGGRNHVHGFTASLALFARQTTGRAGSEA
jgi:small ligand-binding sensory domain FIST